jgi:hypothetical protein
VSVEVQAPSLPGAIGANSLPRAEIFEKTAVFTSPRSHTIGLTLLTLHTPHIANLDRMSYLTYRQEGYFWPLACLVGLVYLVCLVGLVYLVYLVCLVYLVAETRSEIKKLHITYWPKPGLSGLAGLLPGLSVLSS